MLPIVCDVLYNTKCTSVPPRSSAEDDRLFERVLIRDVKLWKSARDTFHQLLMGTFMKDAEYKKKFSKDFVRVRYKLLVSSLMS